MAGVRLQKALCLGTDVPNKEMESAKLSAEWRDAVSCVRRLGVGDVDADRCIAQAFGWGTQKYWQKEKINQTPDPATVSPLMPS